MALQESAPAFDCFGQKNTKPVSSSENSTGFCECNICLDQARDPVVTLCGHLYCWPCIFKWLHIKSNKQPKCPICKAPISDSSLVPLYGRGNPSSDTGSGPKRSDPSDLVIPSRPSAPGGYYLSPDQQIRPNPSQSQLLNHPSYGLGPVFGPRVTASSLFVAMVGEMVCAMIFRGSGPGLFGGYRYENVYLNGSPRMRRQVMPVEKSLNRLTIFFFCCFLLCLLLF